MKAVDATILLHALHRRSPHHDVARQLLAALAQGRAPWALPWPCVYECLRLVTSARVFQPPMPPAAARRDLQALLASPSLVLLSEGDRHAEVLDGLLATSGATGALVDAARVAALCREHGVSQLFSADLDLLRFAGLAVTNPFLPGGAPRRAPVRARLTR